MCGRYSLSMVPFPSLLLLKPLPPIIQQTQANPPSQRPSHVRTHLRTDLNMPVSSSPSDDGDDAPRQTHNFAPTYRGLVYRAVGHDGGKDGEKEKDGGEKQARKAGEEGQGGEVEEGREGGQKEGEKEVQYKLQTMKWGSYHPSHSFPFDTVFFLPSKCRSFFPSIVGAFLPLYTVVSSFSSRSLFPSLVNRSFLG